MGSRVLVRVCNARVVFIVGPRDGISVLVLQWYACGGLSLASLSVTLCAT